MGRMRRVVNKINPGCHTAHLLFAETGNYRGTATLPSILGAKAKLKCSFSDPVLFLKLNYKDGPISKEEEKNCS